MKELQGKQQSGLQIVSKSGSINELTKKMCTCNGELNKKNKKRIYFIAFKSIKLVSLRYYSFNIFIP